MLVTVPLSVNAMRCQLADYQRVGVPTLKSGLRSRHAMENTAKSIKNAWLGLICAHHNYLARHPLFDLVVPYILKLHCVACL